MCLRETVTFTYLFTCCCFAVSNKVILSAVVGSLSCALLLVIALGVTYRFVRLPSTHRSSLHISPITAIEEQIYAQRSAPPPYPEAMATSRPFDEYEHDEIVGRQTSATPGVECGQSGDEPNDTSALVWNAPNTSDEDLLDVGIDDAPGDGGDRDENIVIALGYLAHWRRQPKPPADSSESSLSAIDCPPNSANVECDTPTPDIDSADTLTQVCDSAVSETSEADHPNDDDDRPLLIC